MIPRPRIGINRARHDLICFTDPAAKRWFDDLSVILRYTIEIVPLHEGLTHWQALRYEVPLRVIRELEQLATYTVNIVTPPARPEWLTTID